MRILVLQPAARDEIAGLDEGLDDGLIGVALIALVVEDAPAGEARRFLGEEAVGIDRVGDARVDAARRQLPAMRHPDVEVVAAMARRGVDEARAGIVGDVLAVEKRHVEVVADEACRQRMRAVRFASRSASRRRDLLMVSTLAALNTPSARASARMIGRTDLRPIVLRRAP